MSAPEQQGIADLVAELLQRVVDEGQAGVIAAAACMTMKQREEGHTRESRQAVAHFLCVLGRLVKPSKPDLASDLFEASSDVLNRTDRGDR